MGGLALFIRYCFGSFGSSDVGGRLIGISFVRSRLLLCLIIMSPVLERCNAF
jgi:hypothetical protein